MRLIIIFLLFIPSSIIGQLVYAKINLGDMPFGRFGGGVEIGLSPRFSVLLEAAHITNRRYRTTTQCFWGGTNTVSAATGGSYFAINPRIATVHHWFAETGFKYGKYHTQITQTDDCNQLCIDIFGTGCEDPPPVVTNIRQEKIPLYGYRLGYGYQKNTQKTVFECSGGLSVNYTQIHTDAWRFKSPVTMYIRVALGIAL